ncbi:MAG: tyrosine-type recombinase/integrase [Bacteroidota bacterium]
MEHFCFDSLPDSYKASKENPLQNHEFINLTAAFEKWLRVFGFAESTARRSPVYLRSFLCFLETQGISDIHGIKNRDVRFFMNYLASVNSLYTLKKLSQNYKLNHLNAIKLFGRFMRDSKGIIIDTSMKYSQGIVKDRRWLSRGEIDKLYQACCKGTDRDINRAILSICYGLGLRRSEIVGLDYSDIQWSKGIVFVKRAKLSKERFVPMSKRVSDDLETYSRSYRTEVLKRCGRASEDSLIVSRSGKRICANAIYERLQNVAREAGIKTPLALHSLRHSIATHLLENGLSLESISAFLGHSSLESTQIYTHFIAPDHNHHA